MNRVFNKAVIVTVSILLSNFALRGQEGKVHVLDSKSRENIKFAHVCFQEINTGKTHYVITDEKGEAVNPSSGESVLAISFMGYKTYYDTIASGAVSDVYLEPDVFAIDQAVVTASFVPQKVDKSIYRVKMIDRRQIDAKAASNIADVLNNSLNIRINHDPSLGTSMRLKGLSGNNIKILIDGVPVIGRMGGNIDLSQMNLYNIDHIEMVEGPMSVVYGSNALAGAINIITKENRYSSLSATLNSYIETKGTYNFDGRIAYRKGRQSFSLSGARNFFNGYSLDSLRSQQWKPKEQYNGDFYYTLSVGEESKLKFQSSVMKERLWSKGDLIPPRYYKAIDDWFNSLRFNNRLEFDNKIGNSYNINFVASHSVYNRIRDTYSQDLSTLTNMSISSEKTSFSASTARLLFGNQNPSNSFSFLSGIDLNYEIGRGERILNERQEIGDYAAFGSFLINLNENISLQPGFRLAYNTKFKAPPVPSVNVKWKLAPAVDVRASYARGYRAPTLKELYIFFVDINHNIQPNDQLKAEYGHNFDLSVTLNTDRKEKTHMTKLDATFFYNNMNNIIVLAERDQASILYQYVNIFDYNTMGGELSFKYSYYPFFDIELGAGTTGTYYSLTDKKQSLSDYKFSPDINMNITGLIPGVDLKVSAFYKFTGETWYFRVEEEDKIEVSVMDGYHNLDLSVMKQLMGNRLSLSAGVKNLFDNTIVRTTGNVGGSVHSGGGGSLVGYGRVFYFKAGVNLYK